MTRKMLQHFDFKLLSLVFFAGIASFVAAKSLLNFSVRYVDSNLPYNNQGYIYEAIGMLQLTLDETDNVEVALPKFLFKFQNTHNFEIWELAGGCDILMLSSETKYIKMNEITTNVEVNLFAVDRLSTTTEPPTDPTETFFAEDESSTSKLSSFYSGDSNVVSNINETDFPSTSTPYYSTASSTLYPTTSSYTTTPSSIPFSVTIISSSVPSSTYLYNAVGILQYYLGQQNDITRALPLFLEAYQKEEPNYTWKISSECDILILSNDGVYIKLLEEYTNTEIKLFG
ncbi:uncharacterized protein [Euwallacea similis]|uniref:uncharacterized protein n=1 Tax=Euwallacea similis TaxID=1736056 RepID=UPI00344DBBA7